MTGLELLAVALGMRHGVDPDHLAAVDGLSRVRPSPLNGVLFALGHGGVVTLLAFPAASLLGRVDLEALHLPAFLLLLVAALNLYRLLKPTPPTPPKGLPPHKPHLTGVLYGLVLETANHPCRTWPRTPEGRKRRAASSGGRWWPWPWFWPWRSSGGWTSRPLPYP